MCEEALKGRDDGDFACGLVSFAHEQKAGGVIGDGEGVTIASVAELEFALEVGAPQIVGVLAR